MREIKFVEGSLADLVYDLVLNHVREHSDALDGWVSSEDGVIQGAVSIQRGDDNSAVAYVYQDDPLTDADKKSVTEQIQESVWEEDEEEDEDE